MINEPKINTILIKVLCTNLVPFSLSKLSSFLILKNKRGNIIIIKNVEVIFLYSLPKIKFTIRKTKTIK
jgi:hypothetical protein